MADRPAAGGIAFWTGDTGIDGENPGDLGELGLVPIDPLPSFVWYQHMVDVAGGISDRAAGDRLSRSLQSRGAFRRFKNELYQGHPGLISAWQTFRDVVAQLRAAQWLLDEGLAEEDAVRRFVHEHPEPDLPRVPRRATSCPWSTAL